MTKMKKPKRSNDMESTTEQGFFSRLKSSLKVDSGRQPSPYIIRGTATGPAPKRVKAPRTLGAKTAAKDASK